MNHSWNFFDFSFIYKYYNQRWCFYEGVFDLEKKQARIENF